MVAVEISKVVVVTVNVIFMIFGLACLITGIVFKVSWDEVREAFVDNSDKVDVNLAYAGDTLAYSAIIFGAFIIIVSLLGCIGACCQVKCLLVVYAIIVMILLIGQVTVVALVVVNGSDSEEDIKQGLKESLRDYYENSTLERSKSFSALFSTFECCGITDYTNDFTLDGDVKGFYRANERPSDYDLIIPITCCKDVDYESTLKEETFTEHQKCLKNPAKDNAYTTGCYTKIRDAIDDNKSIILGVGITIFIIEIIVIIMAFVICCRAD